MTTVSVILCSHNRAAHLKETLASLRTTDVPAGWTVEVLLVDNASTDDTPAVMRAFEHPQAAVRVLQEKNRGLSHARNCGVRAARGRVLLFTDDDVRLPDGWMEGMATPILEGTADAVAGGVELSAASQRAWMTAHHRDLLASTERIDPACPERMVGANMAVSARVFEVVPGFDPALGPGRLGLGGETLFSLQLRAAGFQIASAFEVAVRHCPEATRMSREAWKEAAAQSGRAGAYRSYHWAHRHYALPVLLAGWLYQRCRLGWYQGVQALWGGPSSPMPTRELLLRRRVHRVRQHLREYGKPAKHDPHALSTKARRSPVLTPDAEAE